MGEQVRGEHEAASGCFENDEKEKDFCKAWQFHVELFGLPGLQQILDEEERGDAR